MPWRCPLNIPENYVNILYIVKKDHCFITLNDDADPSLFCTCTIYTPEFHVNVSILVFPGSICRVVITFPVISIMRIYADSGYSRCNWS